MSRRILIVDDNAVTRRLVRISLRDHFEVLEAGNAIEAVATARDEMPDLILQDMVLPDVDGFELLEQLRAVVGVGVPILAFTGLVAHQIEARLGAASFDDVVSKPVDPARLKDIVRSYFPSETGVHPTFGKQRRVVLADDDPVQLKLTAFRLGRMGFEVFPATNGEEALALARAKRPDAIISDVLMPKMDGFELCSRVRADDVIAATPLLLLTNSYLEDRDFDLAARVGADGYVVRTPELTELAALLAKTFASPNRRTVTPSVPDPSVQNDRIERALRQLDRQVVLNSALTQRNAMLSAELAILNGLTAALTEYGDPESALDTALSACFDAGGISWGVLLVRRDDQWDQRVIGLSRDALRQAAPTLTEVARAASAPDASRAPRSVVVDALRRTEAGAGEVLLVPVCHRDEVLGVLLLGAGQGMDEHRVAFAGVVAGQIAQTLALSRTFKAYERATAAEKQRARLLRSIFDAIEDPIIVLSPSYEITHFNQAADAMVGRHTTRPQDWVDNGALFQADQRTRAKWDEMPGVRAVSGERVTRQELVSIPGNGQPTRWMSINAQPVRTEEGRIEGAVVVVRNVTNEKLSQAQQMFSDRMGTLGVLAAGVAHEINNPLSAVIAELDMGIEDTVGHPAHEGLLLAREAADRVRVIVRDLKTLSRGETDEVLPVDVCEVMESSLRMASAQTRTRAVIHRELRPVAKVMGNPARLGQVFLNLIVNASHAIAPGNPGANRITVRAYDAPGGLVVAEVSDSGVGMTAEVLQRLFTPFFTTKPVGVGSGLGLSVSQRIVAAMGGTIEVDSQPGAGTTFRISFPAAHLAVGPAAEERPTLIRHRVLVVGEDLLLVQSISRALRPEYDVVGVQDASSALEKLGAPGAFAAVLWQIDLPDVTGLDARQRLKAAGGELASHVVLVGTREALANAPPPVLNRPLDARELRSLLGALL